MVPEVSQVIIALFAVPLSRKGSSLCCMTGQHSSCRETQHGISPFEASLTEHKTEL